MQGVILRYYKTLSTGSLGVINLTAALDVKPYTQASVMMTLQPSSPGAKMTVTCIMGVLSGNALFQTVDTFLLGSTPFIRTYKVIGPEFNVTLSGGPIATNINLDAWVFLN